jgi:hypothetical protein
MCCLILDLSTDTSNNKYNKYIRTCSHIVLCTSFKGQRQTTIATSSQKNIYGIQPLGCPSQWVTG